MALQDILAAISAQADQHIAETRGTHQKMLTQLREQSERAVAKKKQEIAAQKEQRKAQLTAKAQNHAAMIIRNAELKKKQELLDRTYESVVDALTKLPDSETETILRSCLKSITSKGTIHPAKAHEPLIKKLADSQKFTIGNPIHARGGFLFVSDSREQDCTFEHLVSEILRPETELGVAQQLFT